MAYASGRPASMAGNQNDEARTVDAMRETEHLVIGEDGARLYCRVEGNAAGGTIVFSNSLCCDTSMWDAQVDALSQHYLCIRYDHRGHGRSETGKGPGSVDLLANDAIAVMEHCGARDAAWVGLSIGGLIGMRLAARAVPMIERYVLANTSPAMPPPQRWNDRIRVAREQGMASVAGASIARWFTAAFSAAQPAAMTDLAARAARVDPAGYVLLCEALRDADLRPALSGIRAPVLVLASADDVVPVERTREWAEAFATVHVIEQAGHLSNIEQPERFTQAMADFLAGAVR